MINITRTFGNPKYMSAGHFSNGFTAWNSVKFNRFAAASTSPAPPLPSEASTLSEESAPTSLPISEEGKVKKQTHSPITGESTDTVSTSEFLSGMSNKIAEKPKTLYTTTNIFTSDMNMTFKRISIKEDNMKQPMAFHEVPGPEILKLLARFWQYIPSVAIQLTSGAFMYFVRMLSSTLIWNRHAHPFSHMFHKYGPVVRLHGPFGGDILFISQPEHIETIYRQEGNQPIRSTFDSIESYRMIRQKRRVRGLSSLIQPNWQEVRYKVGTPLQKCASFYSTQIEEITDMFISRIEDICNPQGQVPDDFSEEIYKLCVESMGLVILNKKFDLLPLTGAIKSEGIQLLQAIEAASDALRKCESGFQLWRFFETPSWKQLVANCEVINKIVGQEVDACEMKLAEKGRERRDDVNQLLSAVSQISNSDCPLIEALLASNTSKDDISTIILDMLLIGVNATANAMTFILYHLAKNPRIQKNLYEELCSAIPDTNSFISYERLSRLKYLRACVKESLRLQPPIPVLTRLLIKDIVLDGYQIPKGTIVLMTHHVSSLKDENFEDATKFKPERWLVDDNDIHPYATIPFGHGPRSCIAKDLAELQIWMLTAKIIRNFQVKYYYGTLSTKARLIPIPDKPLKFRFIERK